MFSIASFSIFKKTENLQNKIDIFHDKLSDSSILFKRMVSTYLNNGSSKEFLETSKELHRIEKSADTLQRNIQERLYRHNLIPDSRADVLKLIGYIDEIINVYNSSAYKFTNEEPEIPEEYHKDILDLCNIVTSCVDNTAIASRAFFRDFNIIRDYSNKVQTLETEADKIASKLKKEIFSSNLPLANKMHLKGFVDAIDCIADKSEDTIDNLAIFAIKRDI